MTEDEIQAFRKARLADLIRDHFRDAGGQVALARLLKNRLGEPFKDGSYIGQMLRPMSAGNSARPIDDARVREIEAIRNGAFKGWFDLPKTKGSAMGGATRTAGGLPLSDIYLVDNTPRPKVLVSWAEVSKMLRDEFSDDLPALFSIKAPDDALSPRVRKGDTLDLSKDAARSVEAGDAVLVRTGSGHCMLRIFKPKGDESFIAEATNINFLPVSSVSDSAKVVAVVIGIYTTNPRW